MARTRWLGFMLLSRHRYDIPIDLFAGPVQSSQTSARSICRSVRRTILTCMRLLVIVLTAALVITACSSQAEPTTTNTVGSTTSTTSGFGCESAPDSERHSESAFALSVSENPVRPGTEVSLNIGSTVYVELRDSPELEWIDRGITGYGSDWQCWNGTGWVGTHLLVHDGETLSGEPGGTTTVPAIGIRIPDEFSIGVPDVAPGWYRIKVEVFVPEAGQDSPARLQGYAAIEVVAESEG